MIYPAIPLAQTILQLLKAHQLKNIVISPGSRNAPLTIGFSHDDFFNCYSIVDERSAAFFALGMAQQNQTPTVLVCSSGSALLNYYPAISEAFYSDIPLIVLTADRPPHKIDIGDGQTIRQENVFANHILYSANLKLDIPFELNISGDGKHQSLPIINSSEVNQNFNEQEIAKAIHTAILEKGPVHINAPFEEPLYQTLEAPTVSVKEYPTPHPQEIINHDEVDVFIKNWNSAKKKMVLVGVLAPNSLEANYVELLAKDPSVLVFTETTSNLHHENFFPGIDKILAPVEKDEEELKALQPDILLTFGGLVVSKKIKAFLRTYKPKKHFHVNEKKAYNTFFCLTSHFKLRINSFFDLVSNQLQNVESTYQQHWLEIQDNRRTAHEAYLKEIGYSDFLVFNQLYQQLPEHMQLQISNSSAIRYNQLFEMDVTWEIFCNRGTSGIDGSTSTAVGASQISQKPVTLVTGDLSFLYDSNGLWNNYIPKDFTIILVNNGGGGIFRILPGDKNTPEFDTFFETIHHKTGEQLAEMFGFEYSNCSDLDRFSKLLAVHYESISERTKPVILEVFTPRLQNDEILLNYFKFLKHKSLEITKSEHWSIR
ncbi:2-succinyl-5-enolpyruvyl-6-hydroxy-3-cyclohexene-1-carboxylate synthase [Pustulibacterium marinum]|uniref:2-succinyl-5-enolpyruvyl-6-hydroxy-3-cyclohexene-1-carboxylate synthase n=1 Tax=Pustulibacterium marinum TaxID=1224947 RepID=A0A1I7GDQ8_9FLAO|nr:2-succinyl-5-enolpyruvyl-6-hydroxy-3-cyclohexene-1-carboxylic-acid synthase [Pustulibacterium marinum]SFU46386.1 2-succinyl-5-enolpyruvyl-6-hydroxy-3-cyclohexene-1-carboxylate synthase [Pustulibacterium marinum]